MSKEPQKSKSMTDAAARGEKKTGHAPPQRPIAALAPHLVCAGAAKAIEFYKKAFGAEEQMRLPGQGGKLIHAAITINGATVMLTDEMPEWQSLGPIALKGTPVSIHLNVPDVDAAFKRAVDAGAKVTMPVADMFWGDRYGVVTDPFGHKWSLATHQRDMTVDEIKAAMAKAFAAHAAKPPAPKSH